jgi:hypothetical protein
LIRSPTSSRVEDVRRAERGGLLPAGGDPVDGDDPRAAANRELGGDQAEHALPEHGDGLADVNIRGEHGVERDGADTGEGAGQGIEPGREHPSLDLLDRQHDLARVAPQPPHGGAEQGRVGVRSQLDDLADLAVAPHRVRVGAHRCLVDEQPAVGVPAPVQVRVGAPIEREFGAGGDPRVEGSDAHVAGRDECSWCALHLHLAWSGERHHERAGIRVGHVSLDGIHEADPSHATPDVYDVTITRITTECQAKKTPSAVVDQEASEFTVCHVGTTRR